MARRARSERIIVGSEDRVDFVFKVASAYSSGGG